MVTINKQGFKNVCSLNEYEEMMMWETAPHSMYDDDSYYTKVLTTDTPNKYDVAIVRVHTEDYSSNYATIYLAEKLYEIIPQTEEEKLYFDEIAEGQDDVYFDRYKEW